MWMDHWGGWGMGFGGLTMLLFWAILIVVLVLAVRWFVEQSGNGRAKSALEILRERYARGEIQKEEYEQKRRDLLT
jgi:putative membrane protein